MATSAPPLRLFDELGDRRGEAQTVSPLVAFAEIRGAYDEAARLQHEGLCIARELGLDAEVSARPSGLGRLALPAHDGERSRCLVQVTGSRCGVPDSCLR